MKILFERFFYIAHLDNLASIRLNGLLSHDAMVSRGIRHVDIADAGAQRWRNRSESVFGRSIHSYVPLYLNPRNPMLYLRREWHRELTILKISASIIQPLNHVFTDGNAASRATLFSSNRDIVAESIPVLNSGMWPEYVDGKRRMCAEVLIYPSVQPMYLEGAICSNQETARAVRSTCSLVSVIDPKMFFQSNL